MKVCALFGHRDCPENISEKLYNSIEKLILQKNINVFYVGTHGNFDKLAYRVLKQIKDKHSIKIYVVLAYLNNKDVFYDADETIFPSVLENTPIRYAIVKRNNYMIDKCDCVICYVNDSFSNAYTFVNRAKKKSADIINIGSYRFD
ncbi:MAG: hypothetical protein J6S13_06130 [Clostridia bacterium]|nr:hypothetical protein [Clostridia bacterium]